MCFFFLLLICIIFFGNNFASLPHPKRNSKFVTDINCKCGSAVPSEDRNVGHSSFYFVVVIPTRETDSV